MTHPVIVDCDPGIDDMVALLVAAADPDIDLRGVTTVAGNVGAEVTTHNALAILNLAGRPEVPVARGADRPLVREAVRQADHMHGENGLGGVTLAPSARHPDPRHAVELMADTVRAATEPVTLVATGPLTNVALFYATHPALATRLGRLVVMGGSIGAGNVTPAAEFNIWFDPEAAHRVLTEPGLPRPVPTTLVGLDVTYRTAYRPADLPRLRGSGPIGALCADALDHYLNAYRRTHALDAMYLHDAVAVAEAIRPGLVSTEPALVDVDCSDGPSRGNTVVDLQGVLGRTPTARVGTGADVSAVLALITERLIGYGH